MDTVHPPPAVRWYVWLAHKVKEAGAAVAALAVLLGPMVYVGVQLGKADERFNAIDHRFAAVEKRFDERFTTIDKRLDGLDTRLDAIQQLLTEQRIVLAKLQATLETQPRRR